MQQNDSTSDTDSVPLDDELEDKTPPPPSRALAASPPPTPLQVGGSSVIPLKIEGKETRHIRQRVEALEWEDGKAPLESGEQAEVVVDTDTVIKDADFNGDLKGAVVEEAEGQKDVVLHDVQSQDARATTTNDDVELVDAAPESIHVDSQVKDTPEKGMDVVEPEPLEVKEKVEKDVVFHESEEVPTTSSSSEAAAPSVAEPSPVSEKVKTEPLAVDDVAKGKEVASTSDFGVSSVPSTTAPLPVISTPVAPAPIKNVGFLLPISFCSVN